MIIPSFVAAIVALPFLANTVFAADCSRRYTVVDSDICDSISAANNASTYQLAAVNSAIDANCSNLVPGESICLGTVGEDCTTTYVIQANDTCNGISSAYGINLTMLYTNNPNIDSLCSNIYIGEVLCVADSVLVPPEPSSGPVATSIPSTAVNPTSTVWSSSTVDASNAAASSTWDDGSDDDELPWCDEL